MKPQINTGFLLATTAAALSMTLTACGSDNVRSSEITISAAPTTTAASTGAAGALPTPLTTEQLDTMLQDLFGQGRQVSDDQRLAVVQNGEKFRSDLTELRKAMSENPNAKFGVVAGSVVLNGEILEAEFWLDKDGNGNQRSAPLNLVPAQGEWKIPAEEICGILAQTDYKSPACR
ncbi:hypothetical protein HLB23_14005 [Nocardia uniformis]|uniref:Low molecular weight antigen MTB12-like C-terminal domain-containing protein n=1 Tax=Nocardia uniformis TaxID=53432 RepID=A0A849BWM5_9NOCA|nr:hypothetical protein [Nocardia uniformis]NNH70962.1 hypothetical protein [Nocardia uniformis]